MKKSLVYILLLCLVIAHIGIPGLAQASRDDSTRFGIGAKFYGSTPLLTLSSTSKQIGAELTLGMWSWYSVSLLWIGADAKMYVPIEAFDSLVRPYLGGGIIALLVTFGGVGASVVGFDGVLGVEIGFHSLGIPVAIYGAGQYAIFPALSIAGGLGAQFGVRIDF